MVVICVIWFITNSGLNPLPYTAFLPRRAGALGCLIPETKFVGEPGKIL